jgi:hypothetical protein
MGFSLAARRQLILVRNESGVNGGKSLRPCPVAKDLQHGLA